LITFIEFLEAEFMRLYPHIQDNEILECFDDWAVNLDFDEMVDYAEAWGKQFNARCV